MSPKGSAYDTDAQAFFTASGITDLTQKSAVNQLVLNLKSNSLWTKFNSLYPVVGGNATAHSYNLINTAQYQLSFSSGWTHSSTGMTPNGTSAYANTNLNNSTLAQDDFSLQVYSRTNQAQNSALIGCFTGARETSIFPRYGAGQYLYGLNGAEVGFSNTDSTGLFTIVRDSSTTIKAYRNATNVDSRSNSSTGTINENITLSALNSSGARYYFSSHELAFVGISTKLNSSDVTVLNSIITTYQTTLGRNV